MDGNKIKAYLPEPVAWLRAAVGSIPMVGSALDHLIFDKADAVRVGNIEKVLESVSARLERTSEDAINVDWFQSEEALATFKLLFDRVSFEADKEKIETLGHVSATFGFKEVDGDPRRLSVVEHLSQLSQVQIKILSVVAKVPVQRKQFSSGTISQTASAVWLSDIVKVLEGGPKFWQGVLKVDQELEILESHNVLRRLPLFGVTDIGYALTSIGAHAASYLELAGD